MSNNSTDSDVFYVEESTNDASLPRLNTRIVLNSTEMSDIDTREMISISFTLSPRPQFATIDSDSIEPTLPLDSDSSSQLFHGASTLWTSHPTRSKFWQ